ncbi:MAG: hypothetical protein AB1705_28095, partial [Verrucomicrobiota bacterium]
SVWASEAMGRRSQLVKKHPALLISKAASTTNAVPFQVAPQAPAAPKSPAVDNPLKAPAAPSAPKAPNPSPTPDKK